MPSALLDPVILPHTNQKLASDRLRMMLSPLGGRFAEMTQDESDAIISLILTVFRPEVSKIQNGNR